ncbi:MAG: hypothetical protein EU547_01290 [Promethearchaeota archaeon]|nr:MAG: hypothetical protein EU547_01290 [Candidatus Lokiarchaeota archaeon]
MDKRNSISLKNKLKIGDLIDLSLVEIITLNALLEYGNPIIRYTLYTIVNSLIKDKKLDSEAVSVKDLNKHEKRLYNFIMKKDQNSSALSTSSFYNNLSNLEQKGLIQFNRDEKNKIDTVQATPLTSTIIKLMLQFFMSTSVIPDFVKFDEGLTEKIKEISGKERVENIMGIWFSKYINLRLVNWFKNLADEVFILSKKEQYENYSRTDLKNVHISKVYNNQKIREPDNMIEMVAVPNYKKDSIFYNMGRIEVLKEIRRILKPGGMVILVTKDEFILTNDFAADELLKVYKESISDTIFTKELLKDDLKHAGFSKNNIIKYKGCLIGIGWTD